MASKMRNLVSNSRLIKGVAIIFLKMFSLHHIPGFVRSALNGRAVNGRGEPIPWYTYPAIGYLNGINAKDLEVLEFGSGNSTIWWANRCKHVTSIEGDQEWFDSVSTQMPKNVSLYLLEGDDDEIQKNIEIYLGPKQISTFDIIIIDGLHRESLLTYVICRMSEKSILIFDNSEGYSVFELTSKLDLCRVDFFGDAPGVFQMQNTSIFFRGNPAALGCANSIQSTWNGL